MDETLLLKETFGHKDLGAWEKSGRIKCDVSDGILSVENGYITTGAMGWKDYVMTITARAPENAEEVQIWAGFRHYSKDYRYVVALRGGNNNHMYLARYGAEGHDRFLDLAPLEFKPKAGIWYELKVVVVGPKIAVYLNEEEHPRLLVEDDSAPFETGGIALGGSYLKAEFSSVFVSEAETEALDGVRRYEPAPPVSDKQVKRKKQLSHYESIYLADIPDGRREISLDGNWLFLPDNNKEKDPMSDVTLDNGWHVMDVPNFWVPTRAWLEGEKFEGGRLNKGQNDEYHLEEAKRCDSYTFDYEETGAAWYRQSLVLAEGSLDKRFVLHFEGVSMLSEVYVNGKRLHENRGMFGPFDVDITGALEMGENVICLYVDRLKPSDNKGIDTIEDNYTAAWDIIESGGDSGKKLNAFDEMELPRGFYQGMPGGIWKPVTLVVSSKVKVDECYFVSDLNSASVDVWISNSHNPGGEDNAFGTNGPVSLHYALTEQKTSELLCSGRVGEYKLCAGDSRKVHFDIEEIEPKLWAPGDPNLYTLTLSVVDDVRLIDTLEESVGFKTVGIEGNKILINGKPTWIRGANHMPGHIKPNDVELAHKFMAYAVDNLVMATRTHCSPYSKTWMKAADEAGVLVSYEGTWPWLMLRGSEVPPRMAVDFWLDDMKRLFKANRNHPSIFLWTMNNEMNFMIYGAGKVLKAKAAVLNEAMKMVRDLDPSRPIVADSAYFRKIKYLKPRLGMFLNDIDDGDIDDPHIYNSWYESSFYHFTRGEFAKVHAMPGRPLMTQEASTGYPRSQDGLPTRSYLFDHQVPQAWVGNDAYEHSDPSFFGGRHAFLTKGTFETLRRVDYERLSGMMPFAYETWFYNHHDAKRVEPMASVKALKMIYQPVLASIDLQVLHYYAGDIIQTDVVLINDDLTRDQLNSPEVLCEVITTNSEGDTLVLAGKTLRFDDLMYYSKASQKLEMALPDNLEEPQKMEAMLRFSVIEEGQIISVNSYDIVVANKAWVLQGSNQHGKVKRYGYLQGDGQAERLIDFLGIRAKVTELPSLNGSIDKLIIGKGCSFSNAQVRRIKAFTKSGGEVVLLQPGRKARKLFPELIRSYVREQHEVVSMNRKESPVFDGIEPLELSWFPYKPYDNGKSGLADVYIPPYFGLLKKVHNRIHKPKVPHVATGRYSVERMNQDVEVLAQTLQPHGYLPNPDAYKDMGGTPLFDVVYGKGSVRISEIRCDAVGVDPIAARFIKNIIL